MTTWGSILVAVVTAIATTGLAELSRWARDRAADRKRTADWEFTRIPIDDEPESVVVAVTNTGDAAAFDVHFELTGDAQFILHPDAKVDHVRPHDVFLVIIQKLGNGIIRIAWKDSRGREIGPVLRLPFQ